MIKRQQQQQSKIEIVCLNELVPIEHVLRKVTKAVDFEFIRDKTEHLYCQDNGRPAVDPVVLFKMLFLGYLFGIRSERQLVREIQVNIAYRWFLGFDLTTKIPDASTISQNRRRRFRDSSIYQDIFDEIVLFAMKKKLVDGKHLYTDSTHLKANANKNKFVLAQVQKSTKSYLDALDQDITADREAHGKKPLKPKEREPENKEIKQSTTDPESGFMVRDGKPRGFFYLDHRTVDGKLAIITDSYVTPANVHDSIPYLDRLDRQIERFDFSVKAVGLDAGYNTAAISKGLEDRGIFATIGYRSHTPVKGRIAKRYFHYDDSIDCYICPNNCLLHYKTTERGGYRMYASNPIHCQSCHMLSQCTASKTHTKILTRHVWEDSRERVTQNRLSEYGKEIYSRRKETVERSFADAKQLHGHRYARMRGRQKVQEQCLLCAWASNIKKIALALAHEPSNPWYLLLFFMFLQFFKPYKRQHTENLIYV